MKIKRILSALIALVMLLGTLALAEPAAAVAAEAPVVYTHNDRVTLIDGACTDEAVNSFEDAARVVDSVLDQLGGDARTVLDPWRELTDALGNRYYVFQQMCDNTTVMGGAVKVITDGQGTMLGLTSSIEDNPSENEATEGITAEEAERIVLDNAMETRQQTLTVVSGLTERMILPLTLEVDIEAEETEGSRYVWVVYTENPDSSQTHASDLPYLAHYVTLTGEYLYSLPTIVPGDEASVSGFDASYVFEFMEPVDYTGYVDLSTGGEKELTVTVMRDKRTGMYYLGNMERRIVVADCWEFLYNGNRVVLESSPDNMEWDQVGLLTLYNYCRAYDYYRDIGWIGGDGLGTPILVLNNYCDINHVPVDNAAYVGGYLGWQMFLASQGNDLSQCLDVLAHEFTHCVTGSVMTYNAYRNDYGAINEAMSDIQGKTCEMMMEGPENVTWTLGDMGTTQIRSMSEPHLYNQPEHTWDVYYTPNVKTPTGLNDQGGVHTNSSLLNNLAYRLYEKGGMTLEEGRAFWFTVDCAMVPGTDYAQLAELLPWALRASGLEQYDTELRRALDATRLGAKELPEFFDEDRALLTLTLPENEVFDDEQWVMFIYSVNIDKLVDRVKTIFGHVIAGDYSDLPQFVQQWLNVDTESGDDSGKENKGLFATLLDAVFASDEAEGSSEIGEQQVPSPVDRMEMELLEWVHEHLEGVFYNASTNGGQDGHTMRIVSIPGHAVPLLMHGVANDKTSTIDDFSMLVYIAGQWIDMNELMEEAQKQEEQGDDGELTPEVQAAIDRFVETHDGYNDIGDLIDLIFYPVRGGEVNELPADGLENMSPFKSEMPIAGENAEIPQPRMSRPKLETLPEAA